MLDKELMLLTSGVMLYKLLISLGVAIIILYKLYGKRKIYIELVIVYLVSVFINYNIIINEVNILTLEDRVVVILFSMIFACLYNFFFVLIFQKIVERRIINKYEKEFNISNYDYHRELLSDISPAILSYCYNNKIDIEDVIVAIILNLHLNGKIEIESDKIKVLVDIRELSTHERTALLFHKFYEPWEFKLKFKKLLIDDMIKDNYLEKKNASEFDVTYFMDLVIITMIIFFISIYSLLEYSNLIFLLRGIIICYFISGIYVVIELLVRDTVMSKKGLELSSKLKGIRNFLVDFSNIKDKGIDTIKVYEEYMLLYLI